MASKIERETKKAATANSFHMLRDFHKCEAVLTILHGALDRKNSLNQQKDIPAGDAKTNLVQQFKTVAELYNRADEAKAVLDGLMEEVAQTVRESVVGEQVEMTTAVKDRGTAERKAVNEYGGSAERVLDVVRGRVLVETVEGLQAALRALLGGNARYEVVRLKNRYARPNVGGHRDLFLNVRVSLSGGAFFICELQLSMRAMYEASTVLHSHELYEHFRSYFQGSQEAVIKQLEQFNELPDEARNAYSVEDVSEFALKLKDMEKVNLISELLKTLQEYEECVRVNKHKISVLESTLGGNHRETLTACNDMGSLLQDMGDLPAAKEMYSKALVGREEVLGVTHPDTLTSYSNMGTSLFMGDLPAAKELHSKALVGREEVLGVTHPDTLQSYNDMGVLLKTMGDLPAAKEMYSKALAGREKVLGVTHPDTLTSYICMGSLLQAMGDLPSAKEMLSKALVGHEKVLGMTHPDTLTSYDNMGLLLKTMGDLPAAKEIFSKALAGREKVLGVTHPYTLISYSNMGSLLQAMGDLPGAKEMYSKSLVGCEMELGEYLVDAVFTWMQ